MLRFGIKVTIQSVFLSRQLLKMKSEDSMGLTEMLHRKRIEEYIKRKAGAVCNYLMNLELI